MDHRRKLHYSGKMDGKKQRSICDPNIKFLGTKDEALVTCIKCQITISLGSGDKHGYFSKNITHRRRKEATQSGRTRRSRKN